MKKLWILFTALALLAVALPAAAEVTTGLVFYWHGITDFEVTHDAVMDKARVKVAGDVDEFNKISSEIRWSDAGFGWDPALPRIKVFKLDTDITGAMGLDLPVTIKSQVGVWESDGMDYWYPTRGGFTWVGFAQLDQQQSSGAAQLDFGVGPVTLHYYQNMGAGADSNAWVGANGAFGPVAFWASYLANWNVGFGEGALEVDLKYDGKFGDLALTVYPSLNYNLGASQLAWSAGAKVGYKMLTVAAAVGGSEATELFDKVEAEVGAAFGDAALWAAMYMSTFAADAFQGLDIMASYKLGAATVFAGYVFCPDTTSIDVPVDGGEWVTQAGGLYLGVKCSL